MKTPYRLGLDVGSNSIGWCVLDLARPKDAKPDSPDLEPCAIRAMGVRIFPDGREDKSDASLAEARRKARSQRRRRDRFLYRKDRLMQALIRHSLMPDSEKERKGLEILDPYELRARGVEAELSPYELGRALFHIGQRRGFKSNRKTDAAGTKDDDKQATKAGISQLQTQLQGENFATLGAFLHAQRQKRFRSSPSEKNKTKLAWDLYPSRAMYEAEFATLWEKQREYHPQLLGDEAHKEIHGHIFHQRDLKPVPRGRCIFETDKRRAPKALPLYQEFRIRQEIANLKIQYADGHHGEPLSCQQRKDLFDKLRRYGTMSFKSIRKHLGLEKDSWFNLESEKRKELHGDQTGTRLANKKCFGTAWWDLPPGKQNAIVRKILREENEAELIRIAQEKWGLDEKAAQAIAEPGLLTADKGKSKLKGFCTLSPVALKKIVPHLRDGKNYADAVKAVNEPGYHHSDFRDGEIFEQLPYYGEPLQRHVGFGSGKSQDSDEKCYGRVANPTVHIGLNQLRQVVNAMIRRYGHPKEVVIELARKLKQSKEKRDEIQTEQAGRQKKNEARRAKLEELGEDRGDAMLRMRLWEELNEKECHNRRCVYCGKQISVARLFSSEVEIEHILPFRRTLDNSFANKTVSCRECNRRKGDLTPWEAFSHNAEQWNAIWHRAEGLQNKRWRFAEDAMERFENRKDKKDFLDRQLVETQYLSVAAKEYLGKICNPDRVWAIPGRLTAMLRRKWRFNEFLAVGNFKNRDDHRHHAIDAFVVAVTHRGLLQRVATSASATDGEWIDEQGNLVDDNLSPYQRFDREDMRRRLQRIIVSHRPDHSTNGQLLDETAYGIIDEQSQINDHNLVYRKPIEGLNANEIERIRDPHLRQEIQETVLLYQGEKNGLQSALQEIRQRKGIRRIRLTKTQKPVVEISHGKGRFKKAYIDSGNHHIDILDTGGKSWIGVGVSMLDACRDANAEPWRKDHPDARLIMRVHKGDLLCLEDKEGEERIYVVKVLNPSHNRFELCGQNESGNLRKRHTDENDPFRWSYLPFSQIQERKCRRVTVDFLGNVRDPWPGTDPKYNPAPGRARKSAPTSG